MFSRSNLVVALLLIVALLFRIPRISEGLPFFYQEDEGHHYNRVLEMVKSGDLNPHYFRKPSLHFYLRIPFTAAGFLWEVSSGRAKELSDIRSRDPFGLAGYAFSSSHPGIVKWNRAASILLSLGCVFLTFLIAKSLGISELASALAALLVAISPAAVEYSATIGVDGPMAFFCLLTSYLGLKAIAESSLKLHWLMGLSAGLACSSKYNALPIILLPLALWLWKNPKDFSLACAAILGPAIGFLMASPFIIVELPLFLNQFAYEIWHYKIAGHVEHEASPGLPQLWHYTRWFMLQGVGIVPLLIAIMGAVYGLIKPKSAFLAFLLFPFCYLLLMCAQKANFERNMLVMIPYIAVLGALFLNNTLLVHIPSKVGLWLMTLTLLAQPLMSASVQAIQISSLKDTRLELDKWLLEQAPSAVAIAGQLQVPPWVYLRPGVERIDGKVLESSGESIGSYDRVIIPGYLNAQSLGENFQLEKIFSGNPDKQRIVENPEIQVYKRK